MHAAVGGDGPATAWLTSERLDSVIPVPKIYNLFCWKYECIVPSNEINPVKITF